MVNIVVGVDGSPGSRAALRWALDEAKHRPDTKIIALLAWEYSAFAALTAAPLSGGWEPPTEIRESSEARLVETIAAVCTPEDAAIDIIPEAVYGKAAHTLLESSKHADLLVVGSRGLSGLKGFLLGSVSHNVAAHARCPVVVVPDAAHLEL